MPIFNRASSVPLVVTTISAAPTEASQGIRRLILDGETYKRGAGTLPTVTDTPPRCDGSGIALAATTHDEKPVPKIAARAPGRKMLGRGE